MRYAATSNLPEPVVEWGSFTVPAALPSRGSATGEPLDIDRELRGGIRRPHLVAEADGVLLVVGGFRLSLSEKVGLLWARLRLETRSGHEIVSLFPEVIFRPQAFAGQFGFGAQDAIVRAEAEYGSEAAGVSAFSPIVYAGRPSEHSCFWDFTSVDYRSPAGCDQLAFTLRGAAPAALFFRLMVAIVIIGIEAPLYLELPPSSMRVET